MPYSDLPVPTRFELDLFTVDPAVCSITNYDVWSDAAATTSLPSMVTAGTIVPLDSKVYFYPAVLSIEQQIDFYVVATADGGKTAITSQMTLKVGCGTFITVFVNTGVFVANPPLFEIGLPSNLYLIDGFSTESVYCPIVEYRLTGSDAQIQYPPSVNHTSCPQTNPPDFLACNIDIMATMKNLAYTFDVTAYALPNFAEDIATMSPSTPMLVTMQFGCGLSS